MLKVKIIEVFSALSNVFPTLFSLQLLWLISQNLPGVKIRSGPSLKQLSSEPKTCANDLLQKRYSRRGETRSTAPPLSLPHSLAIKFAIRLCSLLSPTICLCVSFLSFLLIDFQLVCFVFRCRVCHFVLVSLPLPLSLCVGFSSCYLPFSCAFPTVNWHT